MAISFVAASAVVTGANPTVNVPAGYAQNDLLVIITTGTAAPTTPAGWTQTASMLSGGRITYLTKFATATEASVAVTLAGTTSKSVMLAYRGVSVTGTVALFAVNNGSTIATQTLTTSSANNYIISVYTQIDGGSRTWTAPASTTSRVNSGSTLSVNGLLIVDEAQAVAGVSTTRTATSSGIGVDLSSGAFSIIPSGPRYWVGGSASWDGTAGSKWALTSGGAGGASVPGPSDDVFFDAASGAVTCTISTGNTGAKSITCTGFTGTLAGTAAISVSGSVTLVAGMTLTYTGILSIIATGTITSAGKTLARVIVNGSGITVTLGDALTIPEDSFVLTTGAIDLNGFTLSTSIFSSSGTNVRSIIFGSSNIVLLNDDSGSTALSMADATNFTYTGTSNFTRVQSNTATVAFGSTAGATSTNAPNFTITSGASALTITSTSSFKSLTFTGSTSTVTGTVNLYGNLTLASGGTYTSLVPRFSGTATITSAGRTLGNTTVNGSGITVTLGDALTLGITNTFTLTAGTLALANLTLSTGIFSSSGSSTRAISFGSGNIALTSTTAATTILGMATVTSFTYTGTGGFTRVQAATATIQFANTAGSIGTNAPNFTVTSGASALTITGTSSFKAFTLTGSTCSVIGSALCYGTLTVAAGGTYTSFTPALLTSQNFTSFGKTFSSFQVNGSGITVTFDDALTAGAFTLTNGTINLNGFTLSAGFFSSNNSNTRVITFGTANIALTSTSGGTTVLAMATATNFTYTGTGGFTRNMAATATMVFGTTGGSVTNAPNMTVNAGASALTITANSWFNNFIFTGSTSTVTASSVNIAGNLTLASGGTYTAVVPTYRASGTLTSTGKTLSALTVNGSGITVTCADALTTTNALTLTLGTLNLKNAATSTVGSLVTTGTTLKYLESTTSGSQATISDSSGTNTVTYLSIKDSNATGGAVFDATSATNVNAGNNTGWLGLVSAGGGGNFIAFFM